MSPASPPSTVPLTTAAVPPGETEVGPLGLEPERRPGRCAPSRRAAARPRFRSIGPTGIRHRPRPRRWSPSRPGASRRPGSRSSSRTLRPGQHHAVDAAHRAGHRHRAHGGPGCRRAPSRAQRRRASSGTGGSTRVTGARRGHCVRGRRETYADALGGRGDTGKDVGQVGRQPGPRDQDVARPGAGRSSATASPGWRP